jgi:hypothetical protein
MLVHDEEGWRERNESVIKRRLKWSLLALGVFAAGGFVLFGILGVRIGIPPTEVIGTLLILFSYVSATIWFMVWLSFWWLRKRAAWGLYEKGIQINPYVFIPYAEVRQIEVKEAGMGLVKIVILEPTTPMKGWARYNYGRVWRMYYEFLGEEGVAELERRVMGVPPIEETPPKLVLYPRARSRD